jgi:hypothetical protein
MEGKFLDRENNIKKWQKKVVKFCREKENALET